MTRRFGKEVAWLQTAPSALRCGCTDRSARTSRHRTIPCSIAEAMRWNLWPVIRCLQPSAPARRGWRCSKSAARECTRMGRQDLQAAAAAACIADADPADRPARVPAFRVGIGHRRGSCGREACVPRKSPNAPQRVCVVDRRRETLRIAKAPAYGALRDCCGPSCGPLARHLGGRVSSRSWATRLVDTGLQGLALLKSPPESPPSCTPQETGSIPPEWAAFSIIEKSEAVA